MKVIYQGNHTAERGQTTTEKDEAALLERVCFGALDKHVDTLRVQRGVNLCVSKSQMQRRIKRAIDHKFTTSEEAKEANTAGSP